MSRSRWLAAGALACLAAAPADFAAGQNAAAQVTAAQVTMCQQQQMRCSKRCYNDYVGDYRQRKECLENCNSQFTMCMNIAASSHK